jgi:threonine dehydrogenase-like Zn-dependent dehydrogenase
MITGQEKAELLAAEMDDRLAEGEVLGENIVSLISTGSERSGFTQLFRPEQYPMQTGSSSIARVIKTGAGVNADVNGLKEGDFFYHSKHHTKYVKLSAADAIKTPDGLAPHEAVFARYAAVSMTAIYRMNAKPVEKILVTGLGLVGLMCAAVLNCMGFEVYATDPSAEHRAVAAEMGIENLSDSFDAWPELKQSAGALRECSGNERALQAAIPFMRKGSDAFQVGVPWQKNSDWDAHSLLNELFYAYVSLHGGWEWFLPEKPNEFNPHSNFYHIESVMKLIKDKKLVIPASMYEIRKPEDCQNVYADIAAKGYKGISMILDWQSEGI